jgi:hypothetical protein
MPWVGWVKVVGRRVLRLGWRRGIPGTDAKERAVVSSTTVRVAQCGRVTLPRRVRLAHGLQVGDALTVLDFVTLDRQHLLGNEALADACDFPVGTPGDALAWWRAKVLVS